MFKLLSHQPSGYGCIFKLDRSADGTATAIFVAVFVTSQTPHCTGVREWIHLGSIQNGGKMPGSSLYSRHKPVSGQLEVSTEIIHYEMDLHLSG